MVWTPETPEKALSGGFWTLRLIRVILGPSCGAQRRDKVTPAALSSEPRSPVGKKGVQKVSFPRLRKHT